MRTHIMKRFLPLSSIWIRCNAFPYCISLEKFFPSTNEALKEFLTYRSRIATAAAHRWYPAPE